LRAVVGTLALALAAAAGACGHRSAASITPSADAAPVATTPTGAPTSKRSEAVAAPGPGGSTSINERGSPARSFAQFRPSRDGFAFVNSFSGSPIPGLPALPGLPNRFGLCGGMSFAAADLFIAQQPPPRETAPPASGSPLFNYLQTRQLDSLAPNLSIAAVFAQWMARPDRGPRGVACASAQHWPEIRKRLEAGQPVVLGLVLSRPGQGALWDNHQVLAYRLDPADPRRVMIYDPNHPRRDTTHLRLTNTVEGLFASPSRAAATLAIGLRTTLLAPAQDRPRLPARADQPVRGFFAMDYRPVPPPAWLSASRPVPPAG
jgi:hypothetical protein